MLLGPLQLQEWLILGAALLLALAVWPPTRRLAIGKARGWLLKRQWTGAVRAASPAHFSNRTTIVRKIKTVKVGHRLSVVLPRGASVEDLAARSATIAAALGVRDVRVVRDAHNARWAWVTIVRRDPLATGLPSWPSAGAPQLSLWDKIPVGMDEDGNVVTTSVPGRHLLIGGESGAGKSVALSMVVATAALDPDVTLWLFDGKMVELAVWEHCAERTVEVSVEEANEVLRELQVVMEDRYRQLKAAGKRKVVRGDGMPLHLIVVDELAHYVTFGDTRQCRMFGMLMRDMVSRGRAAGIIVVAATQKPAADIIPTALRDLFGFRWALRCLTPQASDTVLGQGQASRGANAATIGADERGVGYLLREDRDPVRLRSFHLSDGELEAIARRAAALRPARPVAKKSGLVGR